MRSFFLFLLFFLFSAPVFSASAWRNATFVENYPWQAGFSIRFEADEDLCKKNYGRQWRVKCSSPLGQYGQWARGVKMTPAAEGHWEWQNPNTLVFVPENARSLKPSTTYHLDLTALPLPPNVHFDKLKGSIHTLPRAYRVLDSQFMVDPAPQGTHRLVVALEFNYPVPQDFPQPELSMPGGGKAGKPELVFNRDRDTLHISWPILKLPAMPGQAIVRLPGYGRIVQGENFEFVPMERAEHAERIPAEENLFRITSATLTTENDPALNRRKILELRTSLHTLPEAVANSLKLWELPLYNGKGATMPCDWANSPGIPGDLVKQSKALAPIPLAENNNAKGIFRFHVPVANDRHLLVRMENLAAAGGQKLARPFSVILHADPGAGQVAFLQPGHILPNSGHLAILGTDLDRIDWEVQLLGEEYLALAAQSSDNAFSDILNRSGISLDSVSTRKNGAIPLPAQKEGMAAHASLDMGAILRELSNTTSGLSVVTLRGFKNDEEKSIASKVVLATGLAPIVKKDAQGTFHCFVHDLASKKPAAGVDISVLGANGRPVATAHTDRDGHAVIPPLTLAVRENRPVTLVFKKAGQLAWLPLLDRQREVDITEFARGANHVAPESLLAHVFSQRGLYRPGDTLHFGCIPRRGDFSMLPENLPLYAEILDPRGFPVWKRSFTARGGMAELSWASSPESLSGTWTLNVKTGATGDILGTCAVKLEQFQPDTLKMRINAPQEAGWVVTDTTPAVSAQLASLHGLPSANHLIKATLQTAPALFAFGKYPSWTFHDPAPFMGNGQKRTLPPARTDAAGSCPLELPSDVFGSASSRVTLLAEGFDATGSRAVSASSSFLASPMKQILGHRFTGAVTNPQFIPADIKPEIEFISVDSNLEQAPLANITFSLVRRMPVTSLVSDGQGGFRYDEVPADLPVRSWEETIPTEGCKMVINADSPGSWLLLARAPAGQVLARIPFNIVGNSLAPEHEPLAPGKMRLETDARNYQPGEEIKLSFALPYEAWGLVTIERDGVHAWKWIKGHAGENLASISIPDNFEGQGHVVATFAREADSNAVYMQPLVFSAAPFMANMAGRDMGLKIAAPASASPGGNLDVRLEAKKPGRVILVAVDEGILQLTGHTTPDPLATLLGNRALDVTTLQTADLLMPPHGHLYNRLAAFGGGAEATAFGARFRNPFKRRNEPPVVFWSGIREVGTEPLHLSIPIPAWYSGNVRLMAVGAGAGCAGRAEKYCPVAGTVSIEPVLPVVLTPGDECMASVIVRNNTEYPRKVELALDTTNLDLHADLKQNLALAPAEEKIIPLDLVAGREPGIGRVNFILSSPDQRIERASEISIRAASPMQTILQTGHGSELPPTRAMYNHGAETRLTLSPVPMPLVAGLARYLETYPHGCAEQLTSRAFSQAVLLQWPQAASKEREKLFVAAHEAIQRRFQEGMGMTLWPGSRPDLLLTAYIADYLLYRRENGMLCDIGLLNSICDALAWNVALAEPTLNAARASAYAIWVLAREGRIVTQMLEELINALDSQGVQGWRNDLAGALLLAAMKEMHMPASIEPEKINISGSGWFDEYAGNALLTTILAKYFPEQLTKKYRENFINWSMATLNKNNFSTFSGCQGARALASLGMGQQGTLPVPECADGRQLAVNRQEMFLEAKAPLCPKFVLENSSAPVYWQIASTGHGRDLPREAKNEGISVKREFLDRNGEPITEIQQGDIVEVKLQLQAHGEPLQDCVVTDLLAGSFEFVIPAREKLPAGVKYLDRQEDRLLLFADVGPEPLEFRYKVRAVTPGKFHIPPLTAEAMYDRSKYGSGAGGELIVKKQAAQ